MKSRGATFGHHVIASLREGVAAMKAGKPFKQTVMRRMIVKGKTVYTRETFIAPVK